jgi:hypothetical protein
MGNRELPVDWRVLVSVNDGADWTAAYESNVQYVYIADVTVEGLIVGEVRPDGSVPSPQKFTVINLAGQRREVSPPAAAGALPQAVLLANKRVGWIAYPGPEGGMRGKLVDEDGREIPLALPTATSIADVQSLIDGSLVVVGLNLRQLVAVFPAQGGQPRVTIEPGFRTWAVLPDGALGLANGPGPLSSARNELPILLDLRAFTATPLTTPSLAGQAGRNRFVAYDTE